MRFSSSCLEAVLRVRRASCTQIYLIYFSYPQEITHRFLLWFCLASLFSSCFGQALLLIIVRTHPYHPSLIEVPQVLMQNYTMMQKSQGNPEAQRLHSLVLWRGSASEIHICKDNLNIAKEAGSVPNNTSQAAFIRFREWIRSQLQKGQKLSFQWVPSHIGIIGNEKAGQEAKGYVAVSPTPLIKGVQTLAHARRIICEKKDQA